jgi:hypothetical protein
MVEPNRTRKSKQMERFVHPLVEDAHDADAAGDVAEV